MRFPGPRNKPGWRFSTAAFVLVLSNCFVIPANAAQQACKPDVISRPKPAQPGPEGIPIELEGDQVESVKEEVVRLRGNATMKHGAEAMSGDELTYFRNTDEVEAKGDVTMYSRDGDRVKTEHLKIQVGTHIGEASEVEYRLAHREQPNKDPEKANIRARGSAEKVYFEGHDVTRLEDVVYTTCNEGKDDVMVYASELTIDQGSGVGTAKNIKVRFKKVPIFYFPWLSFPISDERKTGFLFPSFGSTKNSGFHFSLPYYWNIAPNMDATLTPRFYEKRGVQVGAEYRYLTQDSNGYVYGEVLPSDREYDDDRAAFTYKHDQRFGQRWRGDVDVQWVSDEQYFDDFSNDIQISSSVFLPQSAQLRYNGSIWDVQGRVYAYQSVDDTIPTINEPHSRLPQVTVRGRFPRGPYRMKFDFDSELVNFAHDERLEGWRLDATPSVTLPLETVWGYVKPKMSVRHTSYSLDNTDPTANDSPTRTLPVFSVDSGVYFERRTSWLGTPFIQTLEPRLFYVYIPKKNQDDLPNFDTGPINLNNFGSIFREYRFFGRDRVGDTNQVTLGLTSRMLEANTGREWMRASIGQIFFLQDREINLNPDEVLTENESDFLAELDAEITPEWSVYGYMQWDRQENNVREGKADLYFRGGPRKFVSVGYRYSRDSLEQAIVHAEWPLTPRWHAMLDNRYSFRDSENLETTVGLEYDACCWKVRAFGQRRALSNEQFRNAFIVELELTGLARVRSGF